MGTAAILLLAALGLWWVIVPQVSRHGLTITTLGGQIACASTAATAALLVSGLVVLAYAL